MRPKRPLGPIESDRIYGTDARDGLKMLADESVDCVITSPPYWATRDYDVPHTKWADGSECALGLEPSFHLFVDHLCSIFDEVKRVLKPTGTVWVNLGDKYHNASKWTSSGQSPQSIGKGHNRGYVAGHRNNQRIPEKCLSLIPERFAIEMIDRGWILRNDIVWHKPNHMPESVRDRFTCSWEHLFLFSLNRRYHFDLDAVRVPHKTKGRELTTMKEPSRSRLTTNITDRRLGPAPAGPRGFHGLGKNPGDCWSIPPESRSMGAIAGPRGAVRVPGGAGWIGHVPGGAARIARDNDPRWLPPAGKNPGDFWPIGTSGSTLKHFAIFPEKLIERPILSGCPKWVCKRCGTPKATRSIAQGHEAVTNAKSDRSQSDTKKRTKTVFGCRCKRGFESGIVLDPFMGAGTTAVVARRLGRRFLGFELNPKYVKMAQRRLAAIEGSAVRHPKGQRKADYKRG